MAGITVELDGVPVTTICLDALHIVDVSVHGGLDQTAKARLNAMGGNYTQEERQHLIWLSDESVPMGKVLTVRFTESCGKSDQGKTIEELFPDAAASTQTDFTIDDAMAATIRTRPRLHDQFTVSAETSQGQKATAMSDDTNTDFAFRIVWDWTRPSQARLRLTTNCFDDILARRAGAEHLESIMAFGDSASFTLIA